MLKRTLRRRLARLAVAIAAVGAVWACNAPFIPVPPPGAITFTPETVPDAAGGEKTVWITQGGANAQASSALFYVLDMDRGSGVIQRANADGSFQAVPMDGTRGDHVRIYYQKPTGENSEDTCKLLIEGPDPAPACP
jgi:hypothetical protein